MVGRNVIVRKLDSLEALGAVTNICSDKTGTLTQGKMVVKKAWVVAEGTKSFFVPILTLAINAFKVPILLVTQTIHLTQHLRRSLLKSTPHSMTLNPTCQRLRHRGRLSLHGFQLPSLLARNFSPSTWTLLRFAILHLCTAIKKPNSGMLEETRRRLPSRFLPVDLIGDVGDSLLETIHPGLSSLSIPSIPILNV